MVPFKGVASYSTPFLVGALFAALTWAGRAGEKEDGKLAPLPPGIKVDDAVMRTLQAGPGMPGSIFQFRRQLLEHPKMKGVLKSHLVANGGHENLALTRDRPMFMCFETYAGPMPGGAVTEEELFFGFFLEQMNGTLQVSPGFVELIAWDRATEMYNFWELVENVWHFRGDSNTILSDGMKINVGAEQPKFAGKIRCSGCHTLGGPVMKELQAPHNDWWTKKDPLRKGKLQLDARSADPAVKLAAQLFDNLTDASNLSEQVKKGIDRLIKARAKQGVFAKQLKLHLRSLFSTMEMNLVTDTVPFRTRKAGKEAVELPLDFFVDVRLAGKRKPIPVSFEVYQKGLQQVKSRFAPKEGNLQETHHAFVVPARSYIDNRILDVLVEEKLLDEELIAAVLAVDFTTPVFSAKRAGLFRYVPDEAKNAAELREHLKAALKKAPKDEAAQELLANLTDPKRNAAFHRQKALALREVCVQAAKSPEIIVGWLKLASQRRREVETAETAKHQQGNIVERGFRVIFPRYAVKLVPGHYYLDPETGQAMTRPAAKNAP